MSMSDIRQARQQAFRRLPSHQPILSFGSSQGDRI
jgi:hypothetical protein